MSEDQSAKIKKHLMQGKFVIANRGVGKTRAIARILAFEENAVAIFGLESQKRSMITQLMEFGLSESAARKKVLHADSVNRGRFQDFLIGKDIYVDEWSKNPYRGPYKAAVTSFDNPVKRIK